MWWKPGAGARKTCSCLRTDVTGKQSRVSTIRKCVRSCERTPICPYFCSAGRCHLPTFHKLQTISINSDHPPIAAPNNVKKKKRNKHPRRCNLWLSLRLNVYEWAATSLFPLVILFDINVTSMRQAVGATHTHTDVPHSHTQISRARLYFQKACYFCPVGAKVVARQSRTK